MPEHNDRVRTFAEKVDQARGRTSVHDLAISIGLKSQQTLDNKLKGRTSFKPGEAARLAHVLGLDPVTMLGILWPEIEELDPLGHLRRLLSGVDDKTLAAVEAFVIELLTSETRSAGEVNPGGDIGLGSPTAESRPTRIEGGPPRRARPAAPGSRGANTSTRRRSK